jgi:hypothetical protein
VGTPPLLWGFCQVGSALRSFFVVVEFLEELVVVVPPERCRGERCGVWGWQSPRERFEFFLLERFLFVFRERFFLRGQTAIRKRSIQGSAPAL